MDKLNKFKFNQSHPCISEGPIKAIIKPFEASQKSVKNFFSLRPGLGLEELKLNIFFLLNNTYIGHTSSGPAKKVGNFK